jgi:DNA topoisomerase-3
MKRFAISLAKQKGIKPPPGYTKSGSICRAFLDQYAPKKTDGGSAGEDGPKQASPAQIAFAMKIAQENGIVIPEQAKASSATMSAWIDSNREKQGRKCKVGNKRAPRTRNSTSAD